MKALVGLGNVGKKYERTRHNVGFMFVDKFRDAWHGQDLVFIKPNTMMNNSGEAVRDTSDYYKISPEDIFVVHDDLDLPLGEYKIQFGVGPKVHNGVNSVEKHMKTSDFWRVRIGIDNRDPENRISGEDYVLENFSDKEMDKIENAIFESIKELREKI
jgi:PTH1 family peptidyl-tRNA hydrolase